MDSHFAYPCSASNIEQKKPTSLKNKKGAVFSGYLFFPVMYPVLPQAEASKLSYKTWDLFGGTEVQQ